MRTILFSYVITNIVSTMVITLLWLQNRNRVNGITYWVFDFLLQTLALSLIFLREVIPNWISIDISNTLSMLGSFLGFLGLLKFFSIKINQTHNYLLLIIFPIIHTWFTLFHPSLLYRQYNFAIVSLLFWIQYVWLLFFRINKIHKKEAFLIGFIFICYCAINFVRISHYLINKHPNTDFLKNNPFDCYIILAYQFLFILLSYSLALLVNKHLIEDVLSQEEKFSKAFHSSPYAIMLTRLSDGLIFEANEGFSKISGYTIKEIKGKSTENLKFWANYKDREEVIENLLSNQKVDSNEYCFQTKNGEKITGLYSAQLLTINNETVILSSINDITKRKKIEEALLLSENQLKASNATKDKFFTIIAHDLKSPFNSIIGFSDLLYHNLHKYDTSKIEKFTEQISSTAKQTLILLDNLLNWARTQTGQISFNPQKILLQKLINETVAIISTSAKIKNIELNTLQSVEIMITADKNMLETIIRNLISNALKFTHPGGQIDIYYIVNNKYVEITVKDNGIGMNQETIQNLFKIETNTSTLGTNSEKGSGLGLILCYEFVEKHGGKIWVDSEPNKGSEFHVSLPI